jgi:RNA polymerase sigma-70 factor (ECF subfamily)
MTQADRRKLHWLLVIGHSSIFKDNPFMWPQHEQTAELLANAQGGDANAVNRLLERHRDAVHRMVQLRLDAKVQRRVDVSDVVQDVMVEANRRLQDYLANPQQMPFHLWLRHIARDRIIDAHRRHRGSARRSVDREQPLVAAAGDEKSTFDLVAQIHDRERGPASAVAAQEMARLVEAAIAELPDQDCEIVIMRHYEHLSNQEIAQALGLTEPAASMRYLRAIRKLREVLGEGTEKSQT